MEKTNHDLLKSIFDGAAELQRLFAGVEDAEITERIDRTELEGVDAALDQLVYDAEHDT